MTRPFIMGAAFAVWLLAAGSAHAFPAGNPGTLILPFR